MHTLMHGLHIACNALQSCLDCSDDGSNLSDGQLVTSTFCDIDKRGLAAWPAKRSRFRSSHFRIISRLLLRRFLQQLYNSAAGATHP